jgi:RES domain-containing protein
VNDPRANRLVEALATIDPIPLELDGWRHCRFVHGLLEVPTTALVATRWLALGDPPAIHLSDSADGMWAEARKHAPPGVDLAEYGRRIGQIRVHGHVLDLCDADVRATLGIEEHDLVRDDDISVCRAVTAGARQAGLQGLISPSAAYPTARTIVVFEAGFGGLQLVSEEVRSPPPG